MKISHVIFFLLMISIFGILFSGCTTIKVKIPDGSTESKKQINIGSSSEIQGNYVLTNWQESIEESFTIGFESADETQILEIVNDALGLNRYDIIAFIAGKHEIKAFIPALGIFEHKKNQEDFDPLEMSDMLDKSWRECFKLKMPTEIRLMKAFRIPSTKAINIFVAGEDGKLFKTVISDATKFLDVDDFGIQEFETQEMVKLTKLADDKINAILPIFSKNAVFALLLSGDLLKVGFDSMKIEQTYANILWNGYDLTTVSKDSAMSLIVVGRHPMNPVIIYGWDEVNEFKMMSRKQLVNTHTVYNIFGSSFFIIKTDEGLLLSNADFTKVKAIDNDFATNIASLDFTPDMERIFISSEMGVRIIGSKVENEDLILTSKTIELPVFAKNNADSRYFGKFLNNTYLMVIKGNAGKLIRTKFDKQIEGSIEIKTGSADKIVADSVPSYRDIKKYEILLDKIEDAGDWDAMKKVYVTIRKDFSPTGTYFPGYAGTAMRGGWIEDTLADSMKDRELIAALIMLYWDEDKTAMLFDDNFHILRKDMLPTPVYLKGKQPLIALHRAIIFQNTTPQKIVAKYIEYLKLWGESFIKGRKDFDNLGIEDKNIAKMKEIMLNLGLEIFEYLPAPIRDYHEQLLAAMRKSEFLSDITDLSSIISNKRELFRSKWLSRK